MKKQLLDFFLMTKPSLWRFERESIIYRTKTTLITVHKESENKYVITISRGSDSKSIPVTKNWFNEIFTFTVSKKLYDATSYLYIKVQEIQSYKDVIKQLEGASKLGN